MTASNPNPQKPLRLGSRGSRLALLQDDEVIAALQARPPGLAIQVESVRTRGDANQTAPLAGMGLGIFVRELEEMLLQGRLDLAVHSLKDMPTQLADGLALGAILPRLDARDVLVNRWGCPLDELPEGARIGTSSPRRAAQLAAYAPQVNIVALRGNVETRLRKARGDEADGAILAAAGLLRLGLAGEAAQFLPPTQFVPPPGQGALAVQARAGDAPLLARLAAIDHPETRAAVTAERAFLEALGGGCQVPVGAYAASAGGQLTLTVFLSAPDGAHPLTAAVSGPPDAPHELAAAARRAIAQQGGETLLKAAAGE